MACAELRVLLGDQLSFSISSLKGINPSQDVVLMCEVMGECTYVKHHKKKIAFLFSAMRHFAQELKDAGYRVDYISLDDPANTGSLTQEVARALKRHTPRSVVVTHPGEYRVLEDIRSWQSSLSLPVRVLPDDRFLCSIEDFQGWAEGRKGLRMEAFYRHMRVQKGILMEKDGTPTGGVWNLDAQNRKPPPKSLAVPPPFSCSPDGLTRRVLDLVERRFSDHFGELDPFFFAVTRSQARGALAHFISHRLPHFGDYQDAMVVDEPWMFHSHLGFYLNCGLLLPMECLEAAEGAYRAGRVPLNAAEGFVRQILGWREFVRGMYWWKMPHYKTQNALGANRALPDFYWTAQTRMACLKQCVTQTRELAYAHHIQRLMVLGNFALLAGVAPGEVQDWYLAVYADAYEWVELPNVVGMILFADGGWLASKPYAAGGSYINKMSNYCSICVYDVAQKNGPKACPFNYLYWDFLARHRKLLGRNPRLGMVYKVYDGFTQEKQNAISQDSQRFFGLLQKGEV